MKKTRCEQGHYFDSEKFASCPLCGSVLDEPKDEPTWGIHAVTCRNGHYFMFGENARSCPICGESIDRGGLELIISHAKIHRSGKVNRIILAVCPNNHCFDSTQHRNCPLCRRAAVVQLSVERTDETQLL